jgi:hypothetical protein
MFFKPMFTLRSVTVIDWLIKKTLSCHEDQRNGEMIDSSNCRKMPLTITIKHNRALKPSMITRHSDLRKWRRLLNISQWDVFAVWSKSTYCIVKKKVQIWNLFVIKKGLKPFCEDIIWNQVVFFKQILTPGTSSKGKKCVSGPVTGITWSTSMRCKYIVWEIVIPIIFFDKFFI